MIDLIYESIVHLTRKLVFYSYELDGSDISNTNYPMTVGIPVYNLNIVRNFDEFNLDWMVDRTPYKSRIKTFILCEEEIFEPVEEKLEQIFTEIWNKKVLNVIIIFWNQSLTAVTYTPFPKMRLVFIPPSDLDNENMLFWDKTKNIFKEKFRITGFFDISRALFDRNNPSNLNALDGLDGLLGRLIIEKLNATLDFSVPADGMEIGELFPNNTATGCLADLISGNFDMGINVRFYRLNHFYGRVEATHVIGRDGIDLYSR